MQLDDFEERDDLCRDGQLRVRYSPDVGYLVQVASGRWYATNDTRLGLVGHVPNKQLCGPTLGPFLSDRAAFEAYDAEDRRLRAQEDAGWPD